MTQNEPAPDQFGHSSQAPHGTGGQPPSTPGGPVPPSYDDATQQMPPLGDGPAPADPYGQPQASGHPQPAGPPPPSGQPGAGPQPGYAPQGGYQGTPPPGYGGPGGGPGFPPPGNPGGSGAPSEPGLFDLTLATPVAPRIAKLGLIALWVMGGLTALSGLVGFIGAAVVGAGPWGGGGTMILGAFVEMVLAFAVAVVIVVLGRMLIELTLSVIAGREEAKQKGADAAE